VLVTGLVVVMNTKIWNGIIILASQPRKFRQIISSLFAIANPVTNDLQESSIPLTLFEQNSVLKQILTIQPLALDVYRLLLQRSLLLTPAVTLTLVSYIVAPRTYLGCAGSLKNIVFRPPKESFSPS
jgi:hypothetical protein